MLSLIKIYLHKMNKPDNKKIYDTTWVDWVDMKKYGPASRWLRSLIMRHISYILKQGDEINSVLDVGCGEGTITNMIAENLPRSQVTGIDFSKTGIDCASRAYTRNNLSFVHDNTSDHLNAKYDLITAYEVLEHVEDWESLLGRMAQASEKYIMLSFPTGRMRPFEVIVGHYRNFKPGQVEDFLARHNFVPAHIYYAGFPFYNPLYRELCNITNSAGNSFTTGKYTWKQKTIGWILYFFFNFLSTRTRWGDQFCGLFVKAK